MLHLIDKDALVAEIEKCIYRCNEKKRSCPVNTQIEAICDNKINAYNEVLSFLDTLEVKEVDLEKETQRILDEHFFYPEEDDELKETPKLARYIAKYFFNLGLKEKIMTSKLQQRISVLKMGFWTGLQTFEETEMTLSDAYNQGVDDILEELGLKVAQKGE